MSEMIERVAKAIDEASQPPGQKDYKILMGNCARAAIEAMRNPDDKMIEAGFKEFGSGTLQVYQAMVDAALSH